MHDRRSIVLALAALAFAAAVVAMASRVVDAGPLNGELSPWNAVFASRLMLITVRVCVLLFLVYATGSMLVFMRRGQWLARVGPVEISARARQLESGAADSKAAADILAAKNERLERIIARLEALLQKKGIP